MRSEPQASRYQPATPLLALAGWLGDRVEPAAFPQAILRWRNDRAAAEVGLETLTDDQWLDHFARFEPLPRNWPHPLALRYHGHQFQVYNPELGDGRGFSFAQLRDSRGRLLELGTKGSGQTPWSRTADGRLTLKGAVREVLASERLEALGVNTSRTFSVVETGEALFRTDEPSPARSAVLVRLSCGHVRIGTFQRLAFLGARPEMEALIGYCLAEFPGPPPPADAPGADQPAVILLHQVVERLAHLAGQWMAAGFVHGVLNTDNMSIAGESFDYGPWRFLPKWEPGFTAAYFDHAGLYAFGRQPQAVHWNCGQLAVALRLLAEAPPLIVALERFGALYQAAFAEAFCWRLGVESRGIEADTALIAAAERAMRETGAAPHAFFHRHRGGRDAEGELAAALKDRAETGGDSAFWHRPAPDGLLIDGVEAIWEAIAGRDDWAPLHQRIAAERELGAALGEPPRRALT